MAEAREARSAAKKLLADNKDPSYQKQAARVQAKLEAANTFEQVAKEWHTNKLEGWTEKHGKTVLRRLEIDLFPAMGKRPIKEISSPELLSSLRRIEVRAPEMARRALQYSNDIFGYAIATGRAEINPGYKLSKQLKSVARGHYAAIETREIPEFLSRLRNHEDRMTRQTCIAMRLMMLLFVRTNELVQMRWEEIDWERRTWFVPRTRMKNRKVHMVPLSDQALQMLQEMQIINGHRSYVFAGHRDPRKHMSDNTLLTVLKRMGYKGKMTGHGFRSLAMSAIMEDLGYRYEIPNLQLSHRRGDDLREAYDRTMFLPERIKMMQDWSDYVDRMDQGGKLLKFDKQVA